MQIKNDPASPHPLNRGKGGLNITIKEENRQFGENGFSARSATGKRLSDRFSTPECPANNRVRYHRILRNCTIRGAARLAKRQDESPLFQQPFLFQQPRKETPGDVHAVFRLVEDDTLRAIDDFIGHF